MAASREHALRVRIASEHRRRDPDLSLIADLRRERAAVRIEDYARDVLATAPPLNDDQRNRIIVLLRGDPGSGHAPAAGHGAGPGGVADGTAA